MRKKFFAPVLVLILAVFVLPPASHAQANFYPCNQDSVHDPVILSVGETEVFPITRYGVNTFFSIVVDDPDIFTRIYGEAKEGHWLPKNKTDFIFCGYTITRLENRKVKVEFPKQQ